MPVGIEDTEENGKTRHVLFGVDDNHFDSRFTRLQRFSGVKNCLAGCRPNHRGKRISVPVGMRDITEGAVIDATLPSTKHNINRLGIGTALNIGGQCGGRDSLPLIPVPE